MGIRIIRFIRRWLRLEGLVGLREGREKLQVPPLRFAPVGMTSLVVVVLPEQSRWPNKFDGGGIT
jgi:hypothetical protein